MRHFGPVTILGHSEKDLSLKSSHSLVSYVKLCSLIGLCILQGVGFN